MERATEAGRLDVRGEPRQHRVGRSLGRDWWALETTGHSNQSHDVGRSTRQERLTWGRFGSFPRGLSETERGRGGVTPLRLQGDGKGEKRPPAWSPGAHRAPG